MTDADAWATFGDTYHVMDDLDENKDFLIVEDDTHAEPLFSSSKVLEPINQRIETLKDEIVDEGAIARSEDWTEAEHENSKAIEELQNLKEVFKQKGDEE